MSEREAWQVTDDAAELYEAGFVPAIFAGAARQVADAAPISAGERVLDVGCGTGVLAREALHRVGPDGRVAGLDLNPRMLAVARRLAPGIDWREGEAGALPFADRSFDVVVSQFALMFFPEQVRALAEMWRVLAAPGRLAVAVCGPQEETPGYAALTKVAREVCGPEVVELLRSPFVLGDRGRLLDLFAGAGIDGARIETRPCRVRFPSIDALVLTEVKASPIREVIDAAGLEALLGRARERLAALCEPGGAIAFAMPFHLATARKT